MVAEKITLTVGQIVVATMSNADAMPLKEQMEKAIATGHSVVLSFDGIRTITTSFLNSSIGEIVENHGFDTLKGRLAITNYSPALAKVIVNYINDLKAAQA